MVVEMPANPLLLGIVDDHNMTWVTNVGGIGPDQGRGGKHLFLPPGYDDSVPEGFFVSRSQTWELVVLIRTVPLDGDIPKSIEAAREVRVYPLSDRGEGATFDSINVTDRVVPLPLLEWAGTLEFWRQLHAVIDSETAPPKYRRMLGILAELGIEKGEPFDPSPRMVRILEQAAETAQREMSVVAYANRRQLMEWPDRMWERLPVGPFSAASGDFGTAEVSDIDASDHYFFHGYGTSSAIGRREVGRGSIYYMGYRDGSGAYLDGGKSYKMTIPSPLPAALFWSVTVYDVETRCLIQTGQGRAAVRSHLDEPQANPDGSYDVYFGPSAPEGLEENWISDQARGRLVVCDAAVRSRGAGLRRHLEAGGHRRGAVEPSSIEDHDHGRCTAPPELCDASSSSVALMIPPVAAEDRRRRRKTKVQYQPRSVAL